MSARWERGGCFRPWLAAFLALAVTLGLVAARAAASLEHTLSDASQHLMAFAGAQNQTRPQALTLNGAAVFVSSGASDWSVDEVLAHFRDRCHLAEAGASVPSSPPARVDYVAQVRKWLTSGWVVRHGDGGMVLCLAPDASGAEAWAADVRAAAFAAAGDLATLGELRVTAVTRGKRRTTFVNLWTRGPVALSEMFPEHGDAPGVDHPALPRPPGSRRVLSVQHTAGHSLLNVYRAPADTPLEASFARALTDKGFALRSSEGSGLMVAERAGEVISLSFATGDDTGMYTLFTTLSDRGEP